MKVFISCDMEGISGISSWYLASRKQAAYQEGRRLLTAEVNVAVAACFDAGAEEVWVRDAHSSAHNIIVDQLDERAALIAGWPEVSGMVAEIDETFDACILLGYHSMAGTKDGLMCHTMTERLKAVRVNGTAVGELGIAALNAGAHGVPVVTVTGDAAVCREAEALLPWVKTATVKWAIAREAARMLPLSEARKRVAEAVAAGIEAARSGQAQPLVMQTPLQVEVDFFYGLDAANAAQEQGGERVGSAMVRFEVADGAALARLIGAIC